MNVISAVMVDLECSPLGTRSRLADDLLGKPILRRTVDRALRSKECVRLHLVVPSQQGGRVRELVSGLPCEIETYAAGPPAHQTLVRGGRFWGLDSWRGGAGGFSVFDEDFNAPVLQALLRKTGADAVATIPAAASLFDSAMLDAMIRHARKVDEPTGITFVQAPPGLGPFIIRNHIVDQLAPSTVPPGAILTYQPGHPVADLTGRETCWRPGVEVIAARGRLLCDTRRSTERVERVLRAGAEVESWDAARIVRWLAEVESRRVEDIPSEIEIELTTELPYHLRSILRPLGGDVPSRGPISMRVIQSVADWIRGYDDACVILGGFGEPCLHPEFLEICRALRESGTAALAVRTTGLIESEAIEAALFETPVDLVEVMLDASNPETYARVWGVDEYSRAIAVLERRLERRVRENRVLPLWMPSMVKARETYEDLETFVDTWQRRLSMYAVTGHSHCAGQRPDHAVSSLAPPERCVCRRVRSRAVVLADGTMITCDQDYRARQVIGRIGPQMPNEFWQGDPILNSIRNQIIGDAPLCAACDEWHRP
ncbi:MAG: hypothetical protein KF841_02010 [Phycisphaerae bacterium]|nr:hypothetical protein [Phycisphaerae bacterium]